MATFSTNQFRSGLKVMLDGDPCNMIDVQFVKPGKGQAFVRVKMRNLNTDRVMEKTYKSGESIEGADVVEKEMQYLYSDGDGWHFMDSETYEQLAANERSMGDAKMWLKEEDICLVTLWNGQPISISAPNFATLTITETDPGERGDTSSGGTKPATLETGAVVKVPLFVAEGEKIKVDTRTGEYVSRGKD